MFGLSKHEIDTAAYKSLQKSLLDNETLIRKLELKVDSLEARLQRFQGRFERHCQQENEEETETINIGGGRYLG